MQDLRQVTLPTSQMEVRIRRNWFTPPTTHPMGPGTILITPPTQSHGQHLRHKKFLMQLLPHPAVAAMANLLVALMEELVVVLPVDLMVLLETRLLVTPQMFLAAATVVLLVAQARDRAPTRTPQPRLPIIRLQSTETSRFRTPPL